MKRKSFLLNWFKTILFLFGGLLLEPTVTATNVRNNLQFKKEQSTIFDLSKIDSILNATNSYVEINYTVPSWTLFRRAVTTATLLKDSVSVTALQMAIAGLKNSDTPFNINATLLKDPKTDMGFTWFTNTGATGGKVEIVEGFTTDSDSFNTPDFTFEATCDSVNKLNYCNTSNNLMLLAGIPDNTQKNYLSHKALALNLSPSTAYSYRVGKPGAWSVTGTFSTAKSTTDNFSFIYVTDPQSKNDMMFGASQKNTHTAHHMFPNADFWLNCGDLVESTGLENSEWEYEQFFETQQDIFLNKPWAPVAGNHDNSTNLNFTNHFNTDSIGFDYAMSTVPGSNYSFVYGNALFLALNFEDYNENGYIDSLSNWMRSQVASHPTTKWRIAFYHKTIYTGGGHIGDQDLNDIRNLMAPVFDELKIDLALQGHDHIYEVIGPIYNKKLVANAVSNGLLVNSDYTNVNGKSGGVFNVKNGTLYFLNGRSGTKGYSAYSKTQMDLVETSLGLTNLYGMFTGRLGQTTGPSYSNISVSTDTISIKTFTVNNLNIAIPYDSFKMVKLSDESIKADSILRVANSLVELNYTVPSWTLFLRALTTASSLKDSVSINTLQSAMDGLKSKEMPYNVNITLNKDPKSNLGFAWFTNEGVTGGKVEIVQGIVNDTTAFAVPDFTFNAKCDSVKNLNYCYSSNNLLNLAGIPNNTKRNYTSNKALASGLTPLTTYSYRVGKTNAWSETGTFTTAKNSTDQFSFIYTTDCQENSDPTLNVSKQTTHTAMNMYPNANFWMDCGDIVQSEGTDNSEWEYEQYFQSQQDIFLKNPWAPIIGNHDISTNQNFYHHYNTDSIGFDYAMSTVPGSNYSFVYGDALFMALNFEDFGSRGYLDSVSNWMRSQVAANPDTKWRIAFYHKPVYTGAGHQIDEDITIVRNSMAPVFDELKIDLAIQGHDHIYEVIGPVYNKQLVYNAITGQIPAPHDDTNINGKSGGIFNVEKGTLYFLNGKLGTKKYAANSKAFMDSIESQLGVTNYFEMFTGRFGQTVYPTFSYITVSTDMITVKTYAVSDLNVSSLYDSFKVVKFKDIGTGKPTIHDQDAISIYPVPVKEDAYLHMKIPVKAEVEVYNSKGNMVICQVINGSTKINFKKLVKDVYIMKVKTDHNNYNLKIVKQ